MLKEERHAYLIMAHNEFNILEKQLILLDDKRNDFYIHIDKKVKNFPFDYYKNLIKESNIYFIDRINTIWGHFNLVQCELNLLKEAIKKEYNYYHLISGVDLPLKSNDEIHYFFKKNSGSEFIHYANFTKHIKDRVLLYNFMRGSRSKNIYLRFCLTNLNRITKKIQILINFERKWDSNVKIKYGAQWFSITHELAKYVISKEEWIRKYFKHSSCSDELFLQTIVYNSEYQNNLYIKEEDEYLACLRYIDWKRGNPYTFTKKDFKELIDSDMLFARKFDTKVDIEIVNKIYNYLIKKKNRI